MDTNIIAIIDDSPLVHKVYGEQLAGQGYQIVNVLDSIESVNTVFSQQPDLILLDIQMPKINGYQICRLLKDHPATRDIPIILMTSSHDKGLVSDPRTWSFETGANGYYDKDRGEDLVSLIDKSLPKSRNQKKKTIHHPLSETEIMTSLSHLLDRQLYKDVMRLKELDEKKDAFVSNVSHELKAPLSIIRGFLDNIQDGLEGDLSSKQHESINICLRNVNRLTRLIRDLLDLSKIHAGKMDFKKVSVNMRDIVRDVVESFSNETLKACVHVKIDTQDPLPVITGDYDRLTQVVINLFSNALKHSPRDGVIDIRLHAQDASLYCAIRDEGPGLSQENMTKIFDPFERIHEEKREGTGLGLPIARDIVALNGGQLAVDSTEGQGSTFIICLPLSPNNEGIRHA